MSTELQQNAVCKYKFISFDKFTFFVIVILFTNHLYSQANQPPLAGFNYTANGLSAQFSDISIDLDGTITNWSWNFGDTTFSNEQNPLHNYTYENTYIVYLTVKDDDGDSATTGKIIIVQPNPGGTFGNFTEVTPLDSIFVTPPDKDLWVIATAPADYDNDGDLDIIVLGYYVEYNMDVLDKLILLQNNGGDSTQWNFNYVELEFNIATSGSSDMTWGDVDKDADLDLIVGSDGSTFLYRNDNGNLILTNTQLPPYFEDNTQAEFDIRSITFADYDNDGDNDILLPSVYDENTWTFRTSLARNDGPNGNGGFIFTEVNVGFAGTSHAQSSWADVDGDQDLDLLLVNIAPFTEESFIKQYVNQGNGVFTEINILNNVTIEHGEGQWGDYDGDGDLDILLAGNLKDTSGEYITTLRIYRNDSLTYSPINVIDCIPCEGWFDITAAAWADYNSDGIMDILVAGTYNPGNQIEGRTKIYINNNGVFTDSGNDLPAPMASGMRGGTFSWLDIDNDEDLDYFVAGEYFVPGGNGLVEAQMHIYRNDADIQNNAPVQPTNLNSQINSGNVILSWNSSTDDHTPVSALTYDLELFKDNLPVELPKRLPQPGNISSENEWVLSNLPDGYYKWTIIAVDAAYIGSSAASGEFNIGATNVENESITPVVYLLQQNYPNPFNPETIIKYSLPYAGMVTIKVYNSLGEEVKTLINEIKKAGNYELRFDAKELTSGIYFYKIESGNFRDVKKMIVLK